MKLQYTVGKTGGKEVEVVGWYAGRTIYIAAVIAVRTRTMLPASGSSSSTSSFPAVALTDVVAHTAASGELTSHRGTWRSPVSTEIVIRRGPSSDGTEHGVAAPQLFPSRLPTSSIKSYHWRPSMAAAGRHRCTVTGCV